MCMPSDSKEEPLLAEVNAGIDKHHGPTRCQDGIGTKTTETVDLGSLLGRKKAGENDSDVIGKLIHQGTIVGVVMWVVLTSLALYIAPSDSFEYLSGSERNSCLVVFVLLFVTNGSRLLPVVFRDNGLKSLKNGVMTGLLVVESISVLSLGLMIWFPTPVLIDNVTGMRVHYIRWSSWTALAFTMCWLTESIDLPLNRPGGTAVCWWNSIAMFVSCGTSMVFPFCPNIYCWMTLLVLSIVLFASMPIRAYQQRERLVAMELAGLPSQLEAYDRTRCSYRLLCVCFGAWSLVAVCFIACSMAPTYATPGSYWASVSVLDLENVLEAISKMWYLSILIDTHELVFDEHGRTARKLEDLRSLLTAVWESSSDVIARCSPTEHGVDVVVSPAFLKIAHKMSHKMSAEGVEAGVISGIEESLIMEIDRAGTFRYFRINLAKPVTRNGVKEARDSIRRCAPGGDKPTGEKNLAALAELLLDACSIRGCEYKEQVLMHEFLAKDSKNQDNVLSCEAKVTHLKSGMVLVLLRDISERFKHFEAEKRLVEEATVRRKDDEANRFSRHEVKNGLLAAIGLVDSLQMASSELGRNGMCSDERPTGVSASELFARQLDFGGCLQELDQTLKEVLNTVLDEAMCKEVIYEEYEPKKERVNIPRLLSSLKRHTPDVERRFPLVLEPQQFPQLRIDPQLLRYVYQNAISNACKFGKHGGVIETSLKYNFGTKEFEMLVRNQPGIGHDELAKLSQEDANKVFSPGTQLETNHAKMGIEYAQIKSQSSGDGAWIMQSCAKTLGGKCEIEFMDDCTIFSFRCPLEACHRQLDLSASHAAGMELHLPKETWGIAIDDSKIQRKLLDRLLGNSGIQPNRILILGESADEVYGFKETVKSLVRENPNDRFLIIADENLDITSGGAKFHTVSGSACIEQLRAEMNDEDESRILTLVRSANDSTADIAEYKRRAHGFLQKAPMQKNGFMELIKPVWAERFSLELTSGGSLDTHDNDDTFVAAPQDLIASLDVIGALFSVHDQSSLRARWITIRDKLHMLKGDLKTLKSIAGVKEAIQDVDALLQKQIPDKLLERWLEIQKSMRSLLQQPELIPEGQSTTLPKVSTVSNAA